MTKGFQGGSVVGSFASPDHLIFARALYDKADVLYIEYTRIFSLYSPRMQDVNQLHVRCYEGKDSKPIMEYLFSMVMNDGNIRTISGQQMKDAIAIYWKQCRLDKGIRDREIADERVYNILHYRLFYNTINLT